MNILVIHPKDSSTDFLSEIYKDMECTLVNYKIENEALMQMIQEHDRIIMLGHGDAYGLYGFNKFIIDYTFADLLRTKPNSVYIWCNADSFAQENELKGFITGMIISEWEEAMMYSITPTKELLLESNTMFANSIKESIQLNPKDMVNKAKELYESADNPIIWFNKYRMYYFE